MTVPQRLPGISDVIAADLDDLATELTSGSHTTASIFMLRRDLRLAVRSFLGFSITLTIAGPAVSVAINVLNDTLQPDRTVDALAVQLPPRHDGSTASVIIYADEPHALDDLREDLAEAFDLPPATLIAPPRHHEPIAPGITGLEAFADVHQAIGVLISSGHTPESAGVELIRRAHTTPGGLHGTASALLGQGRW